MNHAWKNTHYIIDNNILFYQMGWLKGKIRIQEINTIKRSGYLSSGRRPALSWNGIVINYGEGYKIYISPSPLEAFLKEMEVLNPEILILEK